MFYKYAVSDYISRKRQSNIIIIFSFTTKWRARLHRTRLVQNIYYDLQIVVMKGMFLGAFILWFMLSGLKCTVVDAYFPFK